MSAPPNDPNDISGDRGMSGAVSAGKRRGLGRWKTVALVVIAGGAIVSFELSGSRHKRGDDDTQGSKTTPIGQTVNPDFNDPPAQVTKATFGRTVTTAPPGIDRTIAAGLAVPEPPLPMMSYAGGGASSVNRASDPAGPGQATGIAADPASQRTRVVFKAGAIEGGRAGRAMDMSLVMRPQVIECTLQNAIDTTQPGPIFCTLSADVKSDSGITLLEVGTQVTGSYSSSISQGQNRMPMVSASAITRYGVPVVFGGQMGDELGRSGVTGDVDSHFGARFGGALLLMASQGAMSAATAALQHGSNNLNLQTGGVESAVAETLRSTVNIAPTIRVDQGTKIGLLLTTPIDFGDSYKLETH